MTERKNHTKWCIPVTAELDDAVEKTVAENLYISKSEFVRDAVRRKLEDMGFNPQVFAKPEAQAT